MKIVHVNGPRHGTGISLGLDEVHFDLHRRLVLIAHPLGILECVRHHSCIVPLDSPALGLVHHLRTYLVVCQEATSIRIRAGSTATCLFVDVSAHVVIFIGTAQGKGAPIERYANHQLVGRATHLLPQLEAIVLQSCHESVGKSLFTFRLTHHIEALVGVLIVFALVQRTVHICESCPVAS